MRTAALGVMVLSFTAALSNADVQPRRNLAEQLAQLQKGRERPGVAHPFYWAAFTLTER